jgi:hypothetical protein
MSYEENKPPQFLWRQIERLVILVMRCLIGYRAHHLHTSKEQKYFHEDLA